jgi:hypothetical protein
VAVFFEDSSAHKKAMELAQRLLARFDEEINFAFNCWRLQELTDPARAFRACEAVSRADIILVSVDQCALTGGVADFLWSCAGLRRREEGAVALLAVETLKPSAPTMALGSQLRHAAQRLRMDYLPLLPAEAGEKINESNEGFKTAVVARPGQFSERLNHDHWGLNE